MSQLESALGCPWCFHRVCAVADLLSCPQTCCVSHRKALSKVVACVGMYRALLCALEPACCPAKKHLLILLALHRRVAQQCMLFDLCSLMQHAGYSKAWQVCCCLCVS